MAEVTGFTAERMLAIENSTVVDGDVDGSGHLILKQRDGTEIDAGSVVGPSGPASQPAQRAFDATLNGAQYGQATSFLMASTHVGLIVVTNAQTDGPVPNTWFMCETWIYMSTTVWCTQFAWSPFATANGPSGIRYERQMYGAAGDQWTPWREVGGVAAGVIAEYGGTTAPVGWILCDGSALSRTQYPALFASISTRYGGGDGSTTFNVPNFKGRTPVGLDAGQTEFDVLGEVGGAKTVALALTEVPSHDHGANTANEVANHTHAYGHSHGIPAINSGTDFPGHTHAIDHDHAAFNVSDPGAAITANFNVTDGTTVPTAGVIDVGSASSPTSALISGTGGTGAHTHSINVPAIADTSGGANAAHQHNIAASNTNSQSASDSGVQTANHKHAITPAGGGGAHNNLQPYVITNFIIKY